MSSNQVDLSSVPANQEYIAELQTTIHAEVALQEGIASACEAIHATKESLIKKKKKRTLVKGANLHAPKDRTTRSKGKDKQGEILLAAKETAPPNTVPPESMLGRRPIAFKKVKVVKKAASSPRPSATAELPPRQTPSTNQTPHSSPAVVEPSSSSFSPPDMDLPHNPPSTSLAGKRPSNEAIFQGNEQRARAAFQLYDPPKGGIPSPPFAAFQLYDPPKGGIPPPPFPDYDPLMASGFFTPEFLSVPYTLPEGQQIYEGTPFKRNLQSFHDVRPLLLEGLYQGYSNDPDPLEVYGDMCRNLIHVANAGFELARRADNLGEENKDLKAQAPFEKVASLEEELAIVKQELVDSQQINVLLNTEKRKPIEDYLGLRKRYEEEAQRLECEVERLEDAVSQHPKKLWAAVENYKRSFEFVATLAATVEIFKKSPEFLDALGANVAYRAYSFVRK
ncbi:hypothetical protein LIER_09258 [Lithospermum erythrorhizon]|uniref:Uncharacterized protein n=1 Tax=Lithospermum erythrorhizon TaxID=34254 RepID=A0AAV3PJU1_LITER